LIILPFGPVPVTADNSIPLASAIILASGDATVLPPVLFDGALDGAAAAGVAATATGAYVAAGVGAAGAAPPSSL